MKRIIYLVCIVFPPISASAKQARVTSGTQINTFSKSSTSFFAKHGMDQHTYMTLFNDTTPIPKPVEPKGAISFSFFYLYGRLGNYDSRYGNASYVNHLRLFGSNWGGLINYKKTLSNNLIITLGVGYLDFEVDKIENETKNGSLTIKTHARPINYPSNLLVLYQTTRYHYNNLCFHIGLGKQFIFFNKLPLFAGVDYLHAYRISGVYYIPFANRYCRTKNHGNFGDFISARFGLKKRLGRFSLAPALVLPIYNGWKQDIIFEEDPSKTVSNWLNGIGISVAISYQISH